MDPRVTVEADIDEFVASCYHDPLRFVRGAYPWGEPGPLEKEEGPDENQTEFLTSLGEEVTARAFDGVTPVMPVQMAETSGHGTGKTATEGWLVDWLMSTRPHCDLTVTAGGYAQLESRTWPAIKFWTGLCLTAPWFDVLETGIYHKDFPDTWKCQMQSCKEQNAQAFAGQHARRSTSGYIFDESSVVPDKVWEVAKGGMTDGEPMIFAFGQMTRNTGAFYKVCYGSEAARWNHRRVDSRSSRFTNKEYIAQQILDYGIDSDYVRVRILGYPPAADELQYIDKARIDQARKRIMVPLQDDPLIAGFDVSGGGKAWNTIRFRRGLCGNPLGSDGKPLGPIRMAGEKDPDRSARIALCAELLNDRRPGHQIAAMFVDSAFGAPIVSRLHALGYTNVHEINFGGESPDRHEYNMRAFMARKCKDHLLLASLPDEDLICHQLGVAGYHHTAGRLVLESKESIVKRGEASPDESDAYWLTFAQAVAPVKKATTRPAPPTRSPWG